MIAALFVQKNGVYYGLPEVDPWDEARDARTYAGPWPVVAHPPCARWGNYWYGGPGHTRRELGDDEGCFEAAIAAVRKWGGVLEHPANSRAWFRFGLRGATDAWTAAGDWIGVTCAVDQGNYGHRSRKPTWLYAVNCQVPSMQWGPSGKAAGIDRSGTKIPVEWLTKRERAATPEPFRDLLIAMAHTAAWHPSTP